MCLTKNSSQGIKTEGIRKGRVFAGLRYVWKLFVEILPLQNSRKKPRNTSDNMRTKNIGNKTSKKRIKTYVFQFVRFEKPNFDRLDAENPQFRPEHRILRVKLCI